NLNAIAMLSRFRRPDVRWRAFYYHEPAPTVLRNPQVQLVKLWPTRAWKAHVALQYQGTVDAIFYPGVEKEDGIGLKWRELSGRRIPIVATMEALVGDAAREALCSEIAGHPVHCARVPDETLRRVDALYKDADLVIAISPFLAKLGTELYGAKFKVQMLGVDPEFAPAAARPANDRPRVVNVASFQQRKRPELFFELAAGFADADFIWYGSGDRLEEFRAEVHSRKLANLSFPGGVSHQELPAILQSADLFVLPSDSEGVPKVSQEASACGVPVVLFGFYEAPSVVHEQNGLVVWNEQELFRAVELLLKDQARRTAMGSRGAEMAREWNWDRRALSWEAEILNFLASR
ncbi:MAG TPA: glycosyltransferase, partial [Terriglobales bacterium]